MSLVIAEHCVSSVGTAVPKINHSLWSGQGISGELGVKKETYSLGRGCIKGQLLSWEIILGETERYLKGVS